MATLAAFKPAGVRFATPAAPPDRPPTARRVLLIESEPGDVRFVRGWLGESSDEPFMLCHADCLASGLAFLAATDFDVVLLDLGLPDSHGLEPLLRVRERAPAVPVVVLGGLDDEAVARQAVNAGAQGYVPKGHVDAAHLGRLLGFVVERAYLLREERAGRGRLAFLEHVSAALVESLDEAQVAQQVAELLVPVLGDLCAVVLVRGRGVPRMAAVAHVDPAKAAVARRLHMHYPLLPDPLVEDLLRTRRAITVPSISAAGLVSCARGAGHLRLLRDLGPRSALLVPLWARGAVLGALCLVATESVRWYGPQDAALAELVASRVALSLSNARLHAELQDALTDRDALFDSVAHDLRSPLQTIKSLGELALMLLPDDQAGTARALTRVDAVTDKMHGVIQELVDARQLRAGQGLSLNREPTDLVALVRTIFENRAEVEPRLRLDAPPTPVTAGVDPPRLLRVIDNLLSNALKYSPEDREVLVTIRYGQGAALLRVEDHGIGIPAPDLSRVFEPYHRAANAPARASGTGLGLWGVKRIVEQHGGTVTLESIEGRGSTVTVGLPLVGA